MTTGSTAADPMASFAAPSRAYATWIPLLGWASRRLLLIYVALSRAGGGRGWCSLDPDSDATALTKSSLIESIHRSLTLPLCFAGWDGLCAVQIYASYLLFDLSPGIRG
ncbi:unnamed protein product [Musa acuminata subsp. burmannicoides]